MKRAVWAAVWLILGFAVSAKAAAPAAAFAASLDRDSVVFAGVTPGSAVALLGASIRTELGMPAQRMFQELLPDDDGDGIVVYQPRRGVPFRSVWAGVDLATGAVAVTAPEGYELDYQNLQIGTLKNDAEGLAAALELEQYNVYLLLVRPGTGAWIYVGAQGSAKDRGTPNDGRLTAGFDDAEPVGTTTAKAPKHVKRDDVLVVLDPGHLQWRTWTVVK